MQLKRENLAFVWTWRDTGIAAILPLGGLVAGGWIGLLAVTIWPILKLSLWADQSSAVSARWIRALIGILVPSIIAGTIFRNLAGYPTHTSPMIWVGVWLIAVALQFWIVIPRFLRERIEDS